MAPSANPDFQGPPRPLHAPFVPRQGTSDGYCPTCLEPFARQGLFDAHRYGPYYARKCLTPDEMRAKGWRRTEKTWHGPPPTTRPKTWKPAHKLLEED